jgi:hypothetical protein
MITRAEMSRKIAVELGWTVSTLLQQICMWDGHSSDAEEKERIFWLLVDARLQIENQHNGDRDAPRSV